MDRMPEVLQNDLNVCNEDWQVAPAGGLLEKTKEEKRTEQWLDKLAQKGKYTSNNETMKVIKDVQKLEEVKAEKKKKEEKKVKVKV